MHLEDEQIQRILHDELYGLEDDVSRHLAGCTECRLRIEGAAAEERRVFNLLGLLDHPAPTVEADGLAARGRRAAIWGRRAAGIVLALGAAGAAYAAPGSPVPGWVAQVAERIMGPSRARVPEPTPVAPAIAGIAVTPGERFTIRFAQPQSRGRATVWVTEGRDVIVRAANGVATFTSGVDGLTVNNPNSSADYEIELPRSARRIEIRVGSRSLLLKENGRIVASTEADSAGRYRVDLSQTPP